jgi:hypothetical protein
MSLGDRADSEKAVVVLRCGEASDRLNAKQHNLFHRRQKPSQRLGLKLHLGIAVPAGQPSKTDVACGGGVTLL